MKKKRGKNIKTNDKPSTKQKLVMWSGWAMALIVTVTATVIFATSDIGGGTIDDKDIAAQLLNGMNAGAFPDAGDDDRQSWDDDWNDDWDDGWNDWDDWDDFEIPPPIILDNTTVATINGTSIGADDVGYLMGDAEWILAEEYFEMFPDDWDIDFSREFRDGATFGRAVREQAVQLAATKIIYAEYAAQHGIYVPDDQLSMINAELDDMEFQMGGDLEAMLMGDAIQGRGHLESIQQGFALIYAVVDAIIADPEKFANFEHYMEEAEETTEELLAAKHILIDIDEFGSEEEAMQFANEIHSRALSGEDFDELIITYGRDPGMMDNPDGYTFVSGMMVYEFEQATRALEIGEISEPVSAFHGIHIILRVEPDEDNVMRPFGQAPLTLEDRMAQAVMAGFETKVADADIVFKPELDAVPVERPLG